MASQSSVVSLETLSHRAENLCSDTKKEKGHVVTEAETGVTQSQAKNGQRQRAVTRS